MIFPIGNSLLVYLEFKELMNTKTQRIDAHRHFGGSIFPAFVWQYIQDTGSKYLGESLQDVVAAMTFQPGEAYGFSKFLSKFNILDEINWTQDLLSKSIKHVADGLAADNIDWAPIRFSINKYISHLKWHRHELIAYFKSQFDEYANGKVGLVLSVKYESQKASQRQLAALIDNPVVNDSVIGIDLVGDESCYDPDFYAGILKDWVNRGKLVMAHVGESQGYDNVITAVTKIGIKDICHGIAALTSPRYIREGIIDILKDNNVCLHMALKSNYQTKSWSNREHHPICTALKHNIQVTIGTDDPAVCETTLDGEFALARRCGITPEQEQLIKVTAMKRFSQWIPRSRKST